MVNLITLPPDISRLLTTYLVFRDITAVSISCKSLYHLLAGNPEFWIFLTKEYLTDDPAALEKIRNHNAARYLISLIYTPSDRKELILECAAKYNLSKIFDNQQHPHITRGIDEELDDMEPCEFAGFVESLAEYGHVELFKCFRERQADRSELGLSAAAGSGTLEIVRYICEERDQSDDEPRYDDEDFDEDDDVYTPGIDLYQYNTALYFAFKRRNNFPIIEYLQQKGARLEERMMNAACMTHVDYIKYLQQRGFELTIKNITEMLSDYEIETTYDEKVCILKYAVEDNDGPHLDISHSGFLTQVSAANVRLIPYLLERGASVSDVNGMNSTIFAGNLEVTQILLRAGAGKKGRGKIAFRYGLEISTFRGVPKNLIAILRLLLNECPDIILSEHHDKLQKAHKLVRKEFGYA